MGKTAAVNVKMKGKTLYHLNSEMMQRGIELEIETGDQHSTRWQFLLQDDGSVYVKKVNVAAGPAGSIQITPHISNIITLK